MSDVWASFLELTDQTCAHMQVILHAEREKRVALLEYDEANMEAVLQKQQAVIMKLETLERSRYETLKILGLEQCTGEDLVNYIPTDRKEHFHDNLKQMRQLATDIKELNQISQKIAKTELGLLGDEVLRVDQSKGGVYGNALHGKRAKKGHFGFQKKM